MNNPMLQAFFVGRALAAAVSEKADYFVSDAISQLGKFDAEQREYFRQFTEEVMARAEQERAAAGVNSSGATDDTASNSQNVDTDDLQATIDNLRAEIAQVRASLQQYKQDAQ